MIAEEVQADAVNVLAATITYWEIWRLIVGCVGSDKAWNDEIKFTHFPRRQR